MKLTISFTIIPPRSHVLGRNFKLNRSGVFKAQISQVVGTIVLNMDLTCANQG